MNDTELLKQYLTGSEQAFAELVGRHGNWIYSVARRRVRDEHLAEDITQAVFILLAQKASKIRPGTPLQPWLLNVARHVAGHAVRTRERRLRHERRAIMHEAVMENPQTQASQKEIADLLDESIGRLGRADQYALLLRFYQQLTLSEVGAQMRSTEEAARKRVFGALQKLKKAIEAAGLSVTPIELHQWMEQNLVQTAPAHLSASSTAAALAGTSGAGESFTLAKGVNLMFLWTKIKIAAMIVMVLLLPGILCVNALMKWVNAADQSPAAAAPASPADDLNQYHHWNMADGLMLDISMDAKQLYCFSTKTGGIWAHESAPQGTTFDLNSTFIATGVAIARAGNHVYGFAPGSGTIAVSDIPADLPSKFAIATDVAAYSTPDHVYAFSGITGQWDSVQLPPNSNPAISLGTDWAMFHDKYKLWAFSPTGGKWRGIDTTP